MLIGTLGTGQQSEGVCAAHLHARRTRCIGFGSARYADYALDTPLAEMPILEDLIDVLDPGTVEGIDC